MAGGLVARAVGVACVAALLVGCATPQEIELTTEPSKVAVSVDGEFIGKSPLIYEIPDVNVIDKIRVRAEKINFESELRTVRKKKSTGLFPDKVHMILEPTRSSGEVKAGGQAQQQGASQMMGPTIVVGAGKASTPAKPATEPTEPAK